MMSPPSSNGQSEKSFQFHDVYLPAEVIQKVVEGGLTKIGLLILMLVQSFSSCGRKKCWASNSYIAQAIGSKSTSHISEIVNEMEQSGMLIITHKGEHRLLRTSWHWANHLPKIPKGASENSEGGFGKFRRGASENSEGGLRKIPNISNIREVIEEKGEPPRGFSSSEEFHSWAVRLRSILRTKSPALPISNGSIDYWTKELKSLWSQLGRDSIRIVKLLDRYERHINKIDRPTITNAKQFCQHFVWLEEEVQKLEDRANLPDGKICRKVKKWFHRSWDEDVPGKKGIRTTKSLRKQFEVSIIGEMVEGDDCRTRFVSEDPDYPFLTDGEGNVWTQEKYL